ncbi:DinB family protein [Paenibacillus roseipurpureus]|uniref:DinB family protein n=1 Tax=Paenibacillus roseopurpureus TaxID=2918901 RepID=A0AA96LLA4_9BACL|nr:DinB family protein [Paenibacillus sp. MBLB1832]WNR43088.1 DinB family protein [Paenibacillus sp. MBLB1832]
MSETTKVQIDLYRATSELIKQRLVGLSEEQLAWKQAPEKWSVKEVVSHLVDASFVHSVRIRSIVAENSQAFLLYEQDAWVSSTKANQSDLKDILAAFDAVLAYNALFYERLTDDQWERKGLNQGKELTISDLFQGFIRHVQVHLAQIQRNLDALASNEHIKR